MPWQAKKKRGDCEVMWRVRRGYKMVVVVVGGGRMRRG
jgi:hypothetical protein